MIASRCSSVRPSRQRRTCCCSRLAVDRLDHVVVRGVDAGRGHPALPVGAGLGRADPVDRPPVGDRQHPRRRRALGRVEPGRRCATPRPAPPGRPPRPGPGRAAPGGPARRPAATLSYSARRPRSSPRATRRSSSSASSASRLRPSLARRRIARCGSARSLAVRVTALIRGSPPDVEPALASGSRDLGDCRIDVRRRSRRRAGRWSGMDWQVST